MSEEHGYDFWFRVYKLALLQLAAEMEIRAVHGQSFGMMDCQWWGMVTAAKANLVGWASRP